MYKNNNDESFEFEAQGGGALPQTLPPEPPRGVIYPLKWVKIINKESFL